MLILYLFPSAAAFTICIVIDLFCGSRDIDDGLLVNSDVGVIFTVIPEVCRTMNKYVVSVIELCAAAVADIFFYGNRMRLRRHIDGLIMFLPFMPERGGNGFCLCLAAAAFVSAGAFGSTGSCFFTYKRIAVLMCRLGSAAGIAGSGRSAFKNWIGTISCPL